MSTGPANEALRATAKSGPRRYDNRFMLSLTSRVVLLASLLSHGLSQTRTQQDDAKSYWNKVYAASRPVFVQEPTALLVNALKERRLGKALDISPIR